MDKKCFIKSKDGCIIEDSDVIILGLTSALAITLSVPLIAILGQLSQIPKR
jgi:hypothetical protein